MTLPTGDQITFNSGGYETATIDLNGLHTTYSYSSGLLTYDQRTRTEMPLRLTYSSGQLLSIEDPALRRTTMTFSGNDLAAVQQADGTHVSYTYNGAGLLTQLEDPISTWSRSVTTARAGLGRSRSPISRPKSSGE